MANEILGDLGLLYDPNTRNGGPRQRRGLDILKRIEPVGNRREWIGREWDIMTQFARSWNGKQTTLYRGLLLVSQLIRQLTYRWALDLNGVCNRDERIMQYDMRYLC
jgi:hypothetical protein